MSVGSSSKHMQKTQERTQLGALTDICWMLIDLCLPEFDAYQGAIFFSKKGLSEVWSEIHLV